jgi:hypothetical protein
MASLIVFLETGVVVTVERARGAAKPTVNGDPNYHLSAPNPKE